MATIKSSRYVGPIKILVEDWDRKLVLFAKTLEEWTECQKKWLYLEQIFTASDIQRQLSQETKIFQQVSYKLLKIIKEKKLYLRKIN
jgi:dynein heavy chain